MPKVKKPSTGRIRVLAQAIDGLKADINQVAMTTESLEEAICPRVAARMAAIEKRVGVDYDPHTCSDALEGSINAALKRFAEKLEGVDGAGREMGAHLADVILEVRELKIVARQFKADDARKAAALCELGDFSKRFQALEESVGKHEKALDRQLNLLSTNFSDLEQRIRKIEQSVAPKREPLDVRVLEVAMKLFKRTYPHHNWSQATNGLQDKFVDDAKIAISIVNTTP